MASVREEGGAIRSGGSSSADERALKTLLVSDLVDSTALVDRLGDERAADVFRQHDRHARDLLRAHGGLEIDKTDGFLLLFERPIEAVHYAVAFHRALGALSKELGLELATRIGIHVGEVHLIRNSTEDVAHGAKPLEVEGLAKPFTARIMSLAAGGQTLLTRTAFDVARRSAVGQPAAEGLEWLSHGRYRLKGVEEAVDVYEVGVRGEAPLRAPVDSPKAHRLVESAQDSGPPTARPSRPDSDLVGTTIGGFRVVRRIGAGGMGVVYEATEILLDRPVALKVLPAELVRDRRRRTRFLREARSAAAVSHPCVATVYQVGEDGDHVFIAMELVRGGSLRQLLSDGPLALEEAVRIGVEIARGMAHAHAAGVIHRDLKPDNVMVAADGLVKLLDFGLAKHVVLGDSSEPSSADTPSTDESVEGRIVGTPGYMSPEQGRGGAVDARSDVFSFGVLLYEVLAGLRPFQGDSALDTLIATSRDPHVPLAEHRPDVPKPTADLVDRCLSKAPSDRYADGSELLEAICLASGLPVPVSRDTEPRVGARPPADRSTASAGSADRRRPGSGTCSSRPASGSSLHPGAQRSAATPGPTALGPKPVRRRLGIGVVALALLVVGAASVGWRVLGRSTGRAPAGAPSRTGSPISEKEGVLACPLLVAAGVEQPSGWLGAAAADLACGRTTVMLGGNTDRTLIPAQLLDLPTEIVDDFPRDPFCDEGARERSIRAARERASGWLDGTVDSAQEGFAIELRLMTPDEQVVAEGNGKGRALYQAVRAALEVLASQGALPVAAQIDPSIARWAGIAKTELALAYFDWGQSLSDGYGLETELARLEAERQALGPLWPLIRFRSSLTLGKPVGTLEAAPLDPASPERYMLTALARSVVDPDMDRATAADRLLSLRREAADPVGRAWLASVESTLRYQLGQNEAAAQVALSVARQTPRLTDWATITGSRYRKKGFAPSARAVAGWTPTNPDGWNMLGYGEPDATEPDRVRMMSRAVGLAPDLPLWSLNLTIKLLMTGQPARAQSLAARFSTGGALQQAASETILALVECSEGRFLAASRRGRVTLSKLDRFGSVEQADVHLLPLALSVDSVLGDASEVADLFAKRFVLVDPPRLTQGHFALLLSANACALASKPVALACFDRLRSLARGNWFLEGQVSTTDAILEGAERYARGDLRGAVVAWRSLIAAGSKLPDYASVGLDEAGEPDLASKNDLPQLDSAPMYGGATLAHVREAERAARAEDFDRARSLAKTVVDAWGTADVDVPAVGQMKKLLAKLPATAKQ